MDCRIGNIERCSKSGCEWKKQFGFSCIPKRIMKSNEKVIDLENIRRNKLTALRWERKGEIIQRDSVIGIRTKRKIIFERDKGICYLCDSKLNFNESTLDHVIPKSRGGHNGLGNLKLCCIDCNSLKDNKLLCELDLTIFKKNNNKIKNNTNVG